MTIVQLGTLIEAMLVIAEHHHTEVNIEGVRISVTQAARYVNRKITVEVASREPRVFSYHSVLGLNNVLEMAAYAHEMIEKFA